MLKCRHEGTQPRTGNEGKNNAKRQNETRGKRQNIKRKKKKNSNVDFSGQNQRETNRGFTLLETRSGEGKTDQNHARRKMQMKTLTGGERVSFSAFLFL